MKVLEIGTEVVTRPAVLMELGLRRYLHRTPAKPVPEGHGILPKLGYNPKCYYGDWI